MHYAIQLKGRYFTISFYDSTIYFDLLRIKSGNFTIADVE